MKSILFHQWHWAGLLAVLCTSSPSLAQEAPVKPQTSVATPADPIFDVMEYQVEGNTVLPAIEIEKAIYPFTGEGKTIKDVEQSRVALEKTYHDAGYLTVLVDIPEQDVKNGLVRLKVTEATVDRLRITGSRYYSLGRIRETAPSLAEGSVPYFPDVQKELADLNQFPDRRVTPVLRAGRSPGTVEVDLKVDDQLPLHASLELTNRYTANTSHTRLGGMLRYDNLWQRNHSLTLNAQLSPENTSESKVFSASYLFPWPQSKVMLATYAIHSKSDVAAVGDVNVLGNGNIYGLRAIIPLAARSNYFHTLTLGADRKIFGETLVLLGSDSINTPIRYTPLMAQYSATLVDDGGATQFNLGTSFALRGMLGNSDAQFENKRFKASANYFIFKGDVQRNQRLPHAWEAVAKLDTQIASQALISNEQFSAGGADSVRGYLESERLGDNGVRGMLELHAPNFAVAQAGPSSRFYPLAFVEGAALRIRDPLPGQQSHFTLSSAGLGLRLKVRQGLSFDLDLARPFKNGAYTRKGDSRVHFKMAYEF